VTVLPDGRFAIPLPTHVETFSYPSLDDAPPLHYPDDGAETWTTFRDYGDGRLFAYAGEGGPLYALNEACEWEVYLDTFTPRCGPAEPSMFCALSERRLLGLSGFGELVTFHSDGTGELTADLDNYGHQRVSSLSPGEGAQVFTTSFINASFQEFNYRTGEGRNIRPCQKGGGQASCSLWFEGRLWLACYAGAEINAYDPNAGGEWPQNPRPVLDIGEEQMRPTGLVADGRYLWCATHARYGHLGGALVRVDPRTETCKVWRDLVPGHNPTGLAVDAERGRVYVGTSTHADCGSAPPAQGPATVFAFDTKTEQVAWVSRPVPNAEHLVVVGPARDTLIVVTEGLDQNLILIVAAQDGSVKESVPLQLPEHWTSAQLFIGGDGELHVASVPDGVFRYDPVEGLGEHLIEGPAAKPQVRGQDLFFIRGHEVGVVEGLWRP